jgi:hypothetical protein
MIFAKIRVRALFGARLNNAGRSLAFSLKVRSQSLTDGLIQWS